MRLVRKLQIIQQWLLTLPDFTCAFIPESSVNNKIPKAGLLTRFAFCGLPILIRTVALAVQKSCILKLTASGNVQDFHLIPF